jgi:hypothetical protein
MDQVMVIASIWTLASNDALEPSAKEKYKARVVLEQDHLRTMLQKRSQRKTGFCNLSRIRWVIFF